MENVGKKYDKAREKLYRTIANQHLVFSAKQLRRKKVHDMCIVHTAVGYVLGQSDIKK